MKKFNEELLDNDPRLVELCLNCKRYKCVGICDEYARVRREVSPFAGKAKYRGKQWEMDGRKMTLSQWAAELGVADRTLRKRVDRGMTLKEAVESYYKRVGKHG